MSYTFQKYLFAFGSVFFLAVTVWVAQIEFRALFGVLTLATFVAAYVCREEERKQPGQERPG